jgi:hypothetical protein
VVLRIHDERSHFRSHVDYDTEGAEGDGSGSFGDGHKSNPICRHHVVNSSFNSHRATE